MSTLDQIQDNVDTFQVDCGLNEEEVRHLMFACDVFHKGIAIPCTGCRYCFLECPKQIDIPSVLSLYNTYKTEGKEAKELHKAVLGKEVTGNDCIGCKRCEAHCQQKIKVATIMKEARKTI